MRYAYIVVVLSAVLLSGCQDKPPARTVFDPMIQAKDKARAVEGKLQESAAQRAADVERAEAGGAK